MTALVVLSTAPNRKTALRIGKTLLKERRISCINIVPAIRSIYLWKGRIVEDNEVLMILKFPGKNREVVERSVLALHPYDTPEFIVIKPSYLNKKYLRWLINP